MSKNPFEGSTIVMAPAELGLPEGAKIVLRKKEKPRAPIPYGIFSEQVADFIPKTEQAVAQREIVANRERYDHVVMSTDEIKTLHGRLSERVEEIPLPFIREPLIGFTMRATYGSGETKVTIETDFAPTKLNEIYIRGRLCFQPRIDFVINFEDTLVFGAIGFCALEVDNYYATTYAMLTKVPKEYELLVLQIASEYFAVQASFHICPEYIVEVAPGEPDPFVEDHPEVPVGKARKIYARPIRRMVYIRERKMPSGRKVHRTCECWYVCGHDYRTKTGKYAWQKGHWKGPKRNDLEARRRTKNYVLDEATKE